MSDSVPDALTALINAANRYEMLEAMARERGRETEARWAENQRAYWANKDAQEKSNDDTI